MLQVQIDTASGTIYRLTQLDHLQTQICVQRTTRLVSSEETVLTLWVDMVFVFSIIWYLESSHAKESATMLLLQMIHGGRIDPLLPTLMTTLVGRIREMELLLRESVM